MLRCIELQCQQIAIASAIINPAILSPLVSCTYMCHWPSDMGPGANDWPHQQLFAVQSAGCCSTSSKQHGSRRPFSGCMMEAHANPELQFSEFMHPESTFCRARNHMVNVSMQCDALCFARKAPQGKTAADSVTNKVHASRAWHAHAP